MKPHTIDDFFDAFRAMPSSDYTQLKLQANRLVGGTTYTHGMDLLHEAVDRTLSGERTWPPGIPLVTFLYNAARSIAHASRTSANVRMRKIEYQHDVDDIWPDDEKCSGEVESTEAIAIARERYRLCEQAVCSVREAMANDPIGLLVLAGILSDMTPAEMRATHRLRESVIKAARQRVHTHIKTWRKDHSDAI